MAGADDGRGARVRDPGTMRQNVEQLYRIWEAAPNNKKADLLLKGPALAWAESWVLSNGQCEPGLKHYITRSLSRSAAQSAAGRAVAETEQLSKESRMYWAVIAMAAFTVTTLLPPLVKEAIDRAAHTHDRPVASVARPDLIAAEPEPQPAAQKEMVVTTVTVGPDGPVVKKEVRQAGPQEKADGFTFNRSGRAQSASAPATPGTPAAKTVGTQPASPSADPRLLPRPKKQKTELELAMDRLRGLGRLSQIALDRGERSMAAQIALEAVIASRTRPGPALDPAIEHEGLSMLYRTMATKVPLLQPGEALASGGNFEFCKDSERTIGLLADGRLEVWSPGQHRKLGSFEFGNTELGRYIASDSSCSNAAFETEDYAVQLVSVAEGKKLVRLRGHEADVSSAEFSTDGTKVITTSFDATGRIWDARTGRAAAILRGHEDRVLGARLSPDGRLAVTWSDDRTARLWDAVSGRTLAKLDGHRSAVSGASFLPDGRRIVTKALDGQVRVWSAATGKLETALETQSGSVLSMELSRDGLRLAAILQDTSVVIWDTTRATRVAELNGGSGETQALMFSPDAKLVATLSWRGEVLLWETDTGRRIASLSRPGDAAASLAFSSDGSRLDAMTQSAEVIGWPIFESPELLLKYAMSTTSCLSPEQRETMQIGRGPSPWCALSSERAGARDDDVPSRQPAASPEGSQNSR